MAETVSPFEWECDYCGQLQTVATPNVHRQYTLLRTGRSTMDEVGVYVDAIRCLNPSCKHLTLEVSLREPEEFHGSIYAGKTLKKWLLLPSSSAKPQPDYIPKALRDDYYEACAIRDDSPKASATLARRCIQGMLHDFCDISERSLWHEIEALKKRVEKDHAPKGVQPEQVQAIEAVRKVGNIGAHMERDINLLVDVDPDEAQLLIGLIELLFTEWYVARRKREEHLAGILKLAADKEVARLARPEQPLQIEAAEVAQITDQSDTD